MTSFQNMLQCSQRSHAQITYPNVPVFWNTEFPAFLLSCDSELNVDKWNDNCEAKSEAKSPRPLRGLQVDFSLTRNVSYAVR